MDEAGDIVLAYQSFGRGEEAFKGGFNFLDSVPSAMENDEGKV